MKRILSMLVVFSMMNAFAQQISDYSYIFISDQPKDFADNKFGLQDLLNSKLKAKNYVTISGESISWPETAKSNPCSVLQADLHNSSSFLKNKLRIDFTDCNQKIIQSLEGKSSIKDYEEGYRDALANAVKTLENSKPKAEITSKNPPKEVQKIQTTEQNLTKTISETAPVKQIEPKATKTEAGAQIYTNGKMDLNRIIISDSQFILASPNSSTPYAIFTASTKHDVYRVQLQNGTQTFGYLEDGKIVIETTNSDGSAGKEIFSKK